MFLLRSYRPHRYGKALDRLLAPSEEEDAQREPGIVLDGGLDGIEWEAGDVPFDGEDDEPTAL
jgi:hypothetical protein